MSEHLFANTKKIDVINCRNVPSDLSIVSGVWILSIPNQTYNSTLFCTFYSTLFDLRFDWMLDVWCFRFQNLQAKPLWLGGHVSIVQICVTCYVGPFQEGPVKTLTLTLCNFTGYPCAYQPSIRSHWGILVQSQQGGVQNVSQIFLPPDLRTQIEKTHQTSS